MAVQKPSKSTMAGIAVGMAAGLVSMFNILTAPDDDPSLRQRSGRVTQRFDHILTPEFMARVAFSESTGNPNAYNPRTGVLGRFQFKSDTFLEQLYKHGPSIGYGNLSRHVTRTRVRDEKGRIIGEDYAVPDKKMESTVLNARKDPVLSERLAKRYIRTGLVYIADRVPGFENNVTEAAAYKVLHFGYGGALKAVRALSENPGTPFVNVVGQTVCRNNPRICYNALGKPRSVKAVHDLLESRLENAPYQTLVLNYPR